jgi:GATA zinc finger
MALIRTKRATTAGQNGGPGQPKSKYRKRSVSGEPSHTSLGVLMVYLYSTQRATPPGKCHSCNIRETPEWRRGPDGARTLCNACGLREFASSVALSLCSHLRVTDYAKLMRKRDKAAGPDGKAPNIDLETLRASTRMAENSHRDANNRSGNTGGNNNNGGSQNTPANAPADTKPPPSSPSQKSDSTRPSPAVSKAGPPQSPVSQATSTYHPNSSGPSIPPQHQPAHAAQMMPPPSIPSGTGDAAPPAWQGTRGYPTEHGSFMRAHAPPSHARGVPP